MGEQDGVHALLQARAVTDEVQAPTCPLALGPHSRVGQPDRQHQIPARELGQHPGINPIGLTSLRGFKIPGSLPRVRVGLVPGLRCCKSSRAREYQIGPGFATR